MAELLGNYNASSLAGVPANGNAKPYKLNNTKYIDQLMNQGLLDLGLKNSAIRTPEQIRGAWKPEGKSIPEYRKDTLGGELGSKAMTTETVAMSPEVVEQAAKNTNTVLESMQSWRDLKKSGDDLDKAMGAVAKYPVRGDPLVAPAVVDMWMNMHDTRGRFTDTTTASDAHKQMQEASFTQKDKVEVLNKLIQHKRGVMDRMAQMSSDVAGRQYRDKITQTDTAKVKGGTEGGIGKGGGSANSSEAAARRNDRDHKEVSDMVDTKLKGGIPEIRASLEIVNGIMGKYKDEEAPGWMKLPLTDTYVTTRNIPFATTEEGKQLRSNVETIQAMVVKRYSGAQASDREVRRKAKELGNALDDSPKSFRRAMREFSLKLAEAEKERELALSPGAKVIYEETPFSSKSEEFTKFEFSSPEQSKESTSKTDMKKKLMEKYKVPSNAKPK